MSEELDYTGFPITILHKNLEEVHAEWMDIKFAEISDVKKLEVAKKKIDALKTAIQAHDAKRVEAGNNTASSSKAVDTQRMKHMQSTVHGLPVFSTGMDVHYWINQLDSYYKLFVVGKPNATQLEDAFLESALSRIQADYLHPIVNRVDDDKIDTYQKLKDYLKKYHSSKMSTFQVLDTVWDLQKTESENLRDYGHRLDDKAVEAMNQITAKWEEEKGAGSTMSVEDVFKLFSGEIYLQYLRAKNPIVYNAIVNDLDKTWSATEISLKALSFETRLTSDEKNYSGPATSLNVNGNKSTQSNSTRRSSGNRVNKKGSNDSRKSSQNGSTGQKPVLNCWNFMEKGTCPRGEHCAYLHDKNMYDKLKRDDKKGPSSSTDPRAHTTIGMPEVDFQ